MKEVTEWNNNPRNMWVWDKDINQKVKRKVIYISKRNMYHYTVMTLTDDETEFQHFMHCAEIEETKYRRMTNQELAWWIREKPTREYKRNYCSTISFEYFYTEENASATVGSDILIREDGDEWREPLVEVTE